MKTELNSRQKKFLRGVGHKLPAVVYVGQNGISTAVLRELDNTLLAHELVKIRIRCDDQTELEGLLGKLREKVQAEIVQVIGHTVLVYRQADEPLLKLPS